VLHRATLPRRLIFLGCTILACLVTACRAPDADTRNRVLQRLAADPVTRDLDFTITVRSGVAIVGGNVASRSQEQRALAIVNDTDGIEDVLNDLVLGDDVIARAVQESFRGDATVASIPVEVTCAKGIVTLRSNSTNADDRTRLLNLARTVDGVIGVVDEMK
jgi:osmotically-inducible protein OsmY